MSQDQIPPQPRPARRFARLPHDKQAERVAQEWRGKVKPYTAIEMLLPEITTGAFLAHTRYNKRCCATLTRDEEHPDSLPNAVSGWGATPAQALVDLAFRWIVLMKESWVTSNHAKLVSEVGPNGELAVRGISQEPIGAEDGR